MKNDESIKDEVPFNPVVHYALQLAAISVLLVWCFGILRPFITPLIWGSVLATALYPAHVALRCRIGNRNGISATIITAVMLMTIIGPAVWLVLSTVDEVKELSAMYQAGTLHIPPPTEAVKDWPVIGKTAYTYWSEASTNLTNFVTVHKDQAMPLVMRGFEFLKTTGSGIAVFAISIIISGFLLGYAESTGAFMRQFLFRIAGKMGGQMIDSASITVRNVAKGVLGVAVIQSIMAGIGFVVVGIPFAGVWILACLILGIIQVGMLPVSIGVIIWIWGNADTTTAVLFTIWMLFVGVIDNVLKPLLMGKGAPAPMLVVFLGAIGGFMFSGFIGLFTGAIVLTVGYNLMIAWVTISNKGGTDAVAPKTEPELVES